MFLRILVTLALFLAASLSPARAQGPIGISAEPAEALLREGLDTPYAQAVLKTFAASVRKHGDASCLQAKGLDDAAVIAGGRALLQRYGMQMKKILDENFDQAAYEAALSASAGAGVMAEIEDLRRDADVAKLIALHRPARLVTAVDNILEHFDRYVLVARIKLDAISPIGRGEPHFKDNPTEAVRANPTEATEEAVQRFVDQHPSPRIDRYLDLLDASEAVALKGYTGAGHNLGPMAFLAGADRDLAELCVGRR